VDCDLTHGYIDINVSSSELVLLTTHARRPRHCRSVAGARRMRQRTRSRLRVADLGKKNTAVASRRRVLRTPAARSGRDRADERFLMCSTAKLMRVAATLKRSTTAKTGASAGGAMRRPTARLGSGDQLACSPTEGMSSTSRGAIDHATTRRRTCFTRRFGGPRR